MTKNKVRATRLDEWMVRKRVRYAGLVGGSLFFCLSLVPSLLPRASVLQGIASGICFAMGYGFGVIIGNIYQSLNKSKLKIKDSPIRHRAIYIALGLVALFFMFKGYQWQNEIRIITDSQKEDFFDPLIILLVTYGVAYLLIGLSRKFLDCPEEYRPKLLKKHLKKRLGDWEP